jgi:hypothetical protein
MEDDLKKINLTLQLSALRLSALRHSAGIGLNFVRYRSQNVTQPILKSFLKPKFPFQALTVGDKHLSSGGRNTIVG